MPTAGATTETQSSIGSEQEELSEFEEITLLQKEFETPTYTQNQKRKNDFETSLIDFINAPIPSPIVPPVLEINPDRSFFESVLPSISNFTEDQKLEFRCEVLNIIKRMRNSPATQNYEYSRNAISPSTSSSTTIDVQAYSEEDTIDIFRDRI